MDASLFCTRSCERENRLEGAEQKMMNACQLGWCRQQQTNDKSILSRVSSVVTPTNLTATRDGVFIAYDFFGIEITTVLRIAFLPMLVYCNYYSSQ
jgi:hypothetical protein